MFKITLHFSLVFPVLARETLEVFISHNSRYFEDVSETYILALFQFFFLKLKEGNRNKGKKEREKVEPLYTFLKRKELIGLVIFVSYSGVFKVYSTQIPLKNCHDKGTSVRGPRPILNS